MLYKNNKGSVDFWPDELNKHKKVLINFSGGTDSTIMTWMLCEKFKELDKDTEIHFSTLVDTERPTNEWNARELILWFKERYDLNWGEHYIGYFTKGSDDGIYAKRHYHGKHTRSIRKPNELTLLTHGRTANPPAEIREKYDLDIGREEVRDTPRPILEGDKYQTYTPFVSVAKDFIAVVYEDNKLQELFNLTASCIAEDYKTDYFHKPCKTCWWCKEKKWAFGCYDFGHM